MTDEELVERFLVLEDGEVPARWPGALLALLSEPDSPDGMPLRPLLTLAISGSTSGFARRRVLARVESYLAKEPEKPAGDSATSVVIAPALRQSQVDTSEELQTLQQGAMQGRFDAPENNKHQLGWRLHLPPLDQPEWGYLSFVPKRFPHRELVLQPEVARWTLSGLDDLRKRLDTNSAIVLCYIYSLFRATAPQFLPGAVVSIEVNLTEVARLCGLPYRTGKESSDSRRVVWEALLYAAAARITGKRKVGRDKRQTEWVQQLTVPFLTIGARLSAPHPDDASLFGHADPPLRVRLHCEPELLSYITGALASYIPGGELLALLPAHQTSSALARAYALHSLTRWRVYRERGLGNMPKLSMQEMLRDVPPAGEAAISLPQLAMCGKNGMRLLTYHRKAVTELEQVGLICPHPDAEDVALRRRLKALGGTLPSALWTRPMPVLLPSARIEDALRSMGKVSPGESET